MLLTLRFQYLPSITMASGLLWASPSRGDANWQTYGLLRATNCMCHARQIMLFSRILSFSLSFSPLNVFHLGEVSFPLYAKVMHSKSLVSEPSIAIGHGCLLANLSTSMMQSVSKSSSSLVSSRGVVRRFGASAAPSVSLARATSSVASASSMSDTMKCPL
uniref:Putative secreted protein n=1 Tax=Ixodes ricinus TaxID=34613 RepID=A0A6B0UXL6_IXORI